ncbi:hypothetical protein [Gelidibacter pelagius]|uniref:Uncharacterized protein n=1 Tax=Gelidibacter pelagius TaxID=2819985 RepID=A0ABS3STT4_9FLAO|nr:hypothetical protein [Gelidibacter pelagius]MBO3098736.1 hypothetical protein [Gelidibacter pelagius]
MTQCFSIDKQRTNSIILLVFISSFLMSCQDKAVHGNSLQDHSLTKEERLDLFLESPITINSSANEQRLNMIKFHKSYILNDNPHFNADSDSISKASSNSYVILAGSHFDKEQDSLIRLASNSDVIEILKNKYVERITYMRVGSNGLQLNYGVHLGMALDDFTKLFPLTIDDHFIASYKDNDSFEVNFIFNQDSKLLKEFNYLSIID